MFKPRGRAESKLNDTIKIYKRVLFLLMVRGGGCGDNNFKKIQQKGGQNVTKTDICCAVTCIYTSGDDALSKS